MGDANDFGDLSSEMEVDAFRRLFPLRFHERHLSESIRPDARSLGKSRETILELGAVASADGSALAKIGFTNLACYKQHWVSYIFLRFAIVIMRGLLCRCFLFVCALTITGWPVDLQAKVLGILAGILAVSYERILRMGTALWLHLCFLNMCMACFLGILAVRLLVGTLKSVGTDDITIPDVERILKAKTVAAASPMAPGGIYTSSQESQNQLVVAAGR